VFAKKGRSAAPAAASLLTIFALLPSAKGLAAKIVHPFFANTPHGRSARAHVFVDGKEKTPH